MKNISFPKGRTGLFQRTMGTVQSINRVKVLICLSVIRYG
jgi:hypothetical protein